MMPASGKRRTVRNTGYPFPPKRLFNLKTPPQSVSSVTYSCSKDSKTERVQMSSTEPEEPTRKTKTTENELQRQKLVPIQSFHTHNQKVPEDVQHLISR